MKLALSLSALRSDREGHRSELSIPSQPIEQTFAQGHEVRLALHTDNCPMLLLPASPSDLHRTLPDAMGLTAEITRYRSQGSSFIYYIQLKCTVTELESVFLDLIENVCERIRNGGNGVASLHQSIDQFRDLLRNPGGAVDRTRIIGLFGELLVLERTLKKTPDAVRSWTGPKGGRRDFFFPGTAIEVKTSAQSGNRTVVIHSLEQLEKDDTEHLHLWYLKIEENPGSGDTVGDVVSRIEQITTDIEQLHRHLEALGYVKSDAAAWNEQKWTLLESQPYVVEAGFPRITPSTFKNGPPPGISHVSYQLDLDHAKDFKVNTADVLNGLTA